MIKVSRELPFLVFGQLLKDTIGYKQGNDVCGVNIDNQWLTFTIQVCFKDDETMYFHQPALTIGCAEIDGPAEEIRLKLALQDEVCPKCGESLEYSLRNDKWLPCKKCKE